MEALLVEAFRGEAVVAYRDPRITKTRKASLWPGGWKNETYGNHPLMTNFTAQ